MAPSFRLCIFFFLLLSFVEIDIVMFGSVIFSFFVVCVSARLRDFS